MNNLVRDYFPLFKQYQAIRAELMDVLTDADLGHQLGGETLMLGELCKEIGEVEHAYIESFKTLKQNFGYRHPDPAIAGSVAALKAWYAALDADLDRVIESFSDEDLASKIVDRGGGFTVPIHIQLDIYKEALIIFYGKASIYLRAMRKPRPHQMAEWIA
ncbi:MAG: DinB family protein [Anaerolineales bacterium]